jgi:anti-sigma B factor antagonist
MDKLSTDGGPQMTFDVSTNGERTVVTISGELDIANVDGLNAAVAPVIERHPDHLVVDVGDLRFADSSAIALWVRWSATVGDIEFRDASPLLRRVITSMGLEGKFRLTP